MKKTIVRMGLFNENLGRIILGVLFGVLFSVTTISSVNAATCYEKWQDEKKKCKNSSVIKQNDCEYKVWQDYNNCKD